jgi:hypothetical protein
MHRRRKMQRFEVIVNNIQRELEELRDINKSLVKENDSLRMKIRVLEGVDEVENVYEGEDNTYLTDILDRENYPKRFCGVRRAVTFLAMNYRMTKLGDFRGKSILDLIEIPGMGVLRCKEMIKFLDNHGVSIEMPPIYSIESKVTESDYETIREIYKLCNLTYTKRAARLYNKNNTSCI